jgi:hypothetical protein
VATAFAADPLFQANPRQIENLLQHVSDGSLALPDFQRDFTWEPYRTRELLRSIMSRYPAGTLLFLRTVGDSGFASREVHGAPGLDGTKPAELILDGQQRITSLYRAMTNKGDERFFVRLDEFLDSTTGGLKSIDEIDFEKALFWVDHDSKDYATTEQEADQFSKVAFPVDAVGRFDEWLDKLVRFRGLNTTDEDALKASLRQVRDSFLNPLRSYGFPVVTLPEKTPLAAVCNVFETLNSTGKPLGPFELLTARFYPKKVNLRELWEAANDDYPALDEFQIEPYSVLQAVTLRAHESAQRADVLNKLTANEASDNWAAAAGGFAGAIDWVSSECGVLMPKWLPYGMILVPIAAIWNEISALKPLQKGKALLNLSRFFWCSVFSESYDQGANSRAGADYQRLASWLFDDSQPAPEAVANFEMTESSLRAATTRRKAMYNGIMALTVKSGATDFHTAQKLSPAHASSLKIDSHHVFPKAYLTKAASPTSPATELILNRALIDRDTNRIIGAKAPSTYLAEIRAVYGEPKVGDVLASHLIDGSTLDADDYEAFLDYRAQRSIELIEDATGAKVTRDWASAA